jgi:hypothetical protein
VYRQYVAQVNEQDFETARINSYVPRYQWFVGLALLLLLADTLLGGGKRASAMPNRYGVDTPTQDARLKPARHSNSRNQRTSKHTHAA